MAEHRYPYMESSGPFPDPGGRERLWEASEAGAAPFPIRGQDSVPASGQRESGGPSARRASEPDDQPDTGQPNTDGGEGRRRRHWGRRRSDRPAVTAGSLGLGPGGVVDRFRKPLIGLAIAGVAAPMINAGIASDPSTEATAELGSGTASAEADLEAGIGDYWAEAEAETVRRNTIEGAMTRWQIDADLATKIYEHATTHGIEPDVAYGLVFTESTFRERAVSHVGARGLTQVMPRTAKWLNPSIEVRDLYDPDTNLDMGFGYLKQLIEKYDGNLEYALTAYNRGPGTVDRILKRGGNPDNGYAGKVLAG